MQQEEDGMTKPEIVKDLGHKIGGGMLLQEKQLKQLWRLSSLHWQKKKISIPGTII
jgi:hypothetical protein